MYFAVEGPIFVKYLLNLFKISILYVSSVSFSLKKIGNFFYLIFLKKFVNSLISISYIVYELIILVLLHEYVFLILFYMF